MDEAGQSVIPNRMLLAEAHEPDFVMETKTDMLICEIKARAEHDDPVVQATAAVNGAWPPRTTPVPRAGRLGTIADHRRSASSQRHSRQLAPGRFSRT